MKTNTITAGAVLRLTQESDIALLPAIERSAAQAFRQIPSLAWLAAKREQETRHGLPPESRCAMRLAL
ncbi:TPA: hypothetical protein MYK38_003173 [Klebsiella pneumoniae]|nr:hypothetical protein [Klebsiella pneumoniae]